MTDDQEMRLYARGYMAGFEAGRAQERADRVLTLRNSVWCAPDPPEEASNVSEAPRKKRKLSEAHKAAIARGRRKAKLARRRAAKGKSR